MGGMTFHVVHSVKGGCGKTAFSLFTALKLAAETAGNAEKTEDSARVLLLDADFKGSGLKTLVYSGDKETFDKNPEPRLEDVEANKKEEINAGRNYLIFRKKYQENNLNDFLTGRCRSVSEIITESGVVPKRRSAPVLDSEGNADGFNGYLDFIFCSPHMKDRDIFSYTNATQPALNVGNFRIKMRKLLQEISERKLPGGEKQYLHVIIDMPPGYDEYSDVLLDVLHCFCRDKKKGNVNYYAVTTGDRSHLDAMQENVRKVLQGNARYRECDKVCAVLSEVRRDEFRDHQRYVEGYCADIKPEINVMKCLYQEEYYNFCRTDRDSFGYTIDDIKSST